MADETPMVATWFGVPLNEIPREELEREFVIAQRQMQLLQDRVSELSIDNIKMAAKIARYYA